MRQMQLLCQYCELYQQTSEGPYTSLRFHGGPYRNKKQQPMHIKMTFLPVRPYPAERGHLGVRCCVGFSQIAREPKWCTSNISSQLARTIPVHRPPRIHYVCATLISVEGSLEHSRHNFRWRSRRFAIAICWSL